MGDESDTRSSAARRPLWSGRSATCRSRNGRASSAASAAPLSETAATGAIAAAIPARSARRAKIAAVIARHANELAGLSPRGRLETLRTPVYLLHGEADNIIPSAETLWMASELPREDLKAMLVSPVLSHLDINGPPPGAMDEWRLVHFFGVIMRAAESS